MQSARVCIIISSNTIALGPLNCMYAYREDGMSDTKVIPGNLCVRLSIRNRTNLYIFSNCLSDLFNTCLVNNVYQSSIVQRQN